MDASIVKPIENIFLKSRGYIFKKPRNKEVVFLASGGLDSSVAIDKIIREWNVKVYPLFIRRGAGAEKFEEQAFDYFSHFYAKKYPKNFKHPYKIKIQIPPKELKPYFSYAMLKKTGYPMRDAALQNVGIQYAISLKKKYNLNIKTLLTAMSPDETFPHCGLTALRLQNLLVCIDTGDWNWQITSPLTEPALGKTLYKKDLILWAIKNNLPLEKTRTCVKAEKKPCGICLECSWRLKAFKKAGINDPLEYK